MALFSVGDRVVIPSRFPQEKLDVLGGLKVGDKGQIVEVYRPTRNTIGLVLVHWDKGFRTRVNEYDLEFIEGISNSNDH